MYIAGKYTNTHTHKCLHTENRSHVQEKKIMFQGRKRQIETHKGSHFGIGGY